MEGKRRIKALSRLGWKTLSDWWWISPYTGHRYNVQGALDIEDLRGGFKRLSRSI